MTTSKIIFLILACLLLGRQVAFSQQKPEDKPSTISKESFRISGVHLSKDSSGVVAVTMEMAGNVEPVKGDFKLSGEDGNPMEIHQVAKAGSEDNANTSTRLIYFLIDASSYTDGVPLQNFKNAVKNSLRLLTDNDLMNIGYFGTSEEVITLAREFNANVGSFEGDIESRISANTDSASKSDAFRATYDAIDELRKSNREGQRILVVISGGVKSQSTEYSADKVASYARKNNVVVHNIAYKINDKFAFDTYRLLSNQTEGGQAASVKGSTDLKNVLGNFLEKRITVSKNASVLCVLTFLPPFKDGAEHSFKINYAGTEQVGKYIAPVGAGGNSGIFALLSNNVAILVIVIVLLLGGLLYWQLNEMRLRRIEREEEELQQQEDADNARQAEIAKREKQQDAVLQELRNQTAKLEDQMRQKETDFIKRTEDLKAQMQFTPTVVPAGKFDMKNTIISGGGGSPVLLVSAGSFSNNFYLNKPTMMIGRAANNDIVVPEQTVSNQHATITIENGSFFLTDLGSTNGTFVNGTRIDKKLLKAGDIIKFGASNCRFEI